MYSIICMLSRNMCFWYTLYPLYLVLIWFWFFPSLYQYHPSLEIKFQTRPKWPARAHSFNAKIGLKNGPPWAEIFKKKQNWVAVWFGLACHIENTFANFSAHSGPFFKPIFALKPWDQDGRFEYNKR